jgi:hypothetical protein
MAEATRPGWLVAVAAGLFLLAILLARLLLLGGVGWAIFAFAAPVLLVALAVRIRFLPALLVVLAFSAASLLFRWLLRGGIGWPLLLLLPVVAVTAAIAGRVLASMRQDRQDRRGNAGAHAGESPREPDGP